MNPNSLTPTVITDKNGRITTVHKKAVVNIEMKRLPKPAIRTQEDFVGEVVLALINSGNPAKDIGIDNPKYERLKAKFSEYHPSTLQRLKGLATTDLGPSLVLFINTRPDTNEEFINDYCMLAPMLNVMGIDRQASLQHLTALSCHPELDPITSGNYSSRRLSQATALIKTINYLDLSGYKTMIENPHEGKMTPIPFITDESLRHYLVSHETPERVAGIIMERELLDPEDIEDIIELENELPSTLQNGAL